MIRFDDSNIEWRAFAGEDGVMAHVFDVDAHTATVDFAIKFAPNTQGIIHRHLAMTHTFVVEGDHVIYEPHGSVRESRPVGRYTVSQITGDIHSEGGGPNGCILIYSVRGDIDGMFDVLDKQHNVVAKFGLAEFQTMLEAQRESVSV
jgi:hypothetical protein